jgi:hypothetical protein
MFRENFAKKGSTPTMSKATKRGIKEFKNFSHMLFDFPSLRD